MSLSNIYVSTPGTVFSVPSDANTYVYLLSSINPIAQEIIIRNTDTSPFIVSTTEGIRFTPSLSTQTLSSFTASNPYSFISVVPRTQMEYMLLEAPGFTNPNRTNRLDLAPNTLFLSTFSTLSLTASIKAQLGDFTIGNGLGNLSGGQGRILTYPGALTTLAASTITAPFISAATLQVSSLQALATTTSTLNTITPIVQTSGYVGATSTLAGTTTATATFQGDLTQTDGLGLGPAALITVGGTAAFQSTLQTTTAQLYGPAAGFGSTFTVAGTTTATATFSTFGSLYVAANTRTDSNYNANILSTISYNALATAHPVKAFFGTSNTNPYTAFVQGNAATTGPFTTPATSSFTVSTATASFSSITFLDGATRNLIAGSNGAILLNGTAITSATYAPFFSTVLASNYVDVRGEFRTSTLQVNLANPTSYSVSSPQYTLEAGGNMYVSSAFVMDNLAVYGGTNPTLYPTPANNTLYASTNGLLINNRLFVDGLQNRVGVNNTNPAYTLDISAQLFVAATNVFNIGTTSWVVASDSALKEYIQDVSGAALDSYSAVIEALPLKRYRYKQDQTYNVDISRAVVNAQGFPVLDGQGEPVLENATVQQTDVGFASEYQLGSAQRYGFIAQDVELFFPNAVYETPFYKYADFNFLTTGPIFNAQYAITRTMVSTVVGHSTIVGRRREFISTVSQRQKDILSDLSGAVGLPYSAITIGVDGGWSAAALFMPPTGLVVKYKDLGFDLSWNSSPSPGMTYRVKIASGGVETVYPIGTATTYSVDGLTDLASYTFKVVGYSQYLKQETAFITATATAYSWPLVLGATITPTSTSFTFNFTVDTTGGTFVKYKIYDATGATLLYDNVPNAAYVVSSGLQAGMNYVYKIIVVTEEGGVIQESAPFTTASVRLLLDPVKYFVDSQMSMTISANNVIGRRYLRYYLMGGGGAGGRGGFGGIWTTASLSVARVAHVATTAGSKIVFAGGASGSTYYNTVDIYDINTNIWSTHNLTVARSNLTATSLGTKMFFAGGQTAPSTVSSVVDIYDISSNTWTTANLSVSRFLLASASAGNKVVFAGGRIYTGSGYSNAVDIYDISSNIWTTATLSVARERLVAAAVGNKIIFAGGQPGSTYTNVVDIYDTSTGIWESTSTNSNQKLSVGRIQFAAASAGNKIYFAGGVTYPSSVTNVVDIYNATTNTWSTTTLSSSRQFLNGVGKNNLIIFAGGHNGTSSVNTVDIFDINTNNHTSSTLTIARHYVASGVLSNKFFFGGGFSTANSSTTSRVDIYTPDATTTYVAGGGGGGSGQARGYLPLTNGSKNYTLSGNTPTPEYIDLSGKTFTDVVVAIGTGASVGAAQGGSTSITIRNNSTPITIVDVSGGFSGSNATDAAPGDGGAGFFGGGGGIGRNFNGSNVSGGAALGGGYAGSVPTQNLTTFVYTSGAGAGPGSSTAGGGSRTLDKASLTELERAGIGGGGGGGSYLGAADASGGSIDNTTRVLAVAGTAYTGQGGGGGVQSGVATEVAPGAGGAGFAVLEFTDELPSGNLVA